MSRQEGGFVRGIESSEEEFEVGKVGRPPLDKNTGAMSPEALKVRKRKLMKVQYHKNKIRVARMKAVMQRKDRRRNVEDHAETDSGDDHEEEEDEIGDDLEVEEGQGEQVGDLEEEKRLHPKTALRIKSEFFRLVPTSLGQQI